MWSLLILFCKWFQKETMKTDRHVSTIRGQYRPTTLRLMKFLLYLGIVAVCKGPDYFQSFSLLILGLHHQK